jgi:hypothetical protein
LLREAAAVSATMGAYQRRWDDWKLQEKVTARELDQIDRQIAAAELRLAIAEKELDNHDLQAEQAREVDATLRDKFTSQDLYDWMTAQIAAVYFQAFQLAYDLAKRAEKAFRFERGVASSSIIQFGHWDSLRKGLLAGERLSLDLKRLELAYLEQDRRELELTKQISLLLHDPVALMSLKATGQCLVSLPEQLFDMDFPGHYLRRIRSVSLTLPCVVGPYTSVNCTLTLLSSKVRISSEASSDYADQDEEHVVQGFTPVQSIATSHAQNDSGTFEVSFRDERYLPFEGAGVISEWRLELPSDTNAFDLDSVSDVVFHLRYTARDGGDPLRAAAREARDAWLADAADAPLARMFSLRQEFPLPWYHFLHATGAQTLQLDLGPERFPFQFRNKTFRVNKVELFLKLKWGEQVPFTLSLDVGDGGGDIPLGVGDHGIVHGSREYASGANLGAWLLSAQAADPGAVADTLEDIVLVCLYSVQ